MIDFLSMFHRTCYFVTLLLCYFVTLLLCYFVTLFLARWRDRSFAALWIDVGYKIETDISYDRDMDIDIDIDVDMAESANLL